MTPSFNATTAFLLLRSISQCGLRRSSFNATTAFLLGRKPFPEAMPC